MAEASSLCRITDVAPRDGLQNESATIPTEDKFELVHRLADAGVDEVEVTSFVSPRWVPQLGDARALFELLQTEKHASVVFSALVPNEKGMHAALETNEQAGFMLLDKVSVFASATETFSKKNINATIAESIERFVPVVRDAQNSDLMTRGYISCVYECPFEGAVDPEAVARVAQMLVDLGIHEIDLGDTIGKGTPERTESLLEAVVRVVPIDRVTMHLHDTFGNAAACLEASLRLGVRSFDSSAAGLGGCPYASTSHNKAPGNISTETLISTIESSGFTHRADRSFVEAASRFATESIARARMNTEYEA